MVRAVLTGRFTGSGFGLAGFNSIIRASLYLWSSWCCIYLHEFFCYNFLLHPLMSWTWWDCPWPGCPLTLVVWAIWPIKSSPKWHIMLSGMLNPTMPFTILLYPLTSTWPHLRCDVGLEEGKYKKKLSLCYSIVYCVQYCVHLCGPTHSHRLWWPGLSSRWTQTLEQPAGFTASVRHDSRPV